MADPEPRAPEQQGKLPLPSFSAEGLSASAISFEAELFLTKFNDWALVCGYSDARKAKALGYALTKAAATWYQQACRRGKLTMDDWSQVELAFRERFVKAVSARFIAGEITKLGQKPKESVADFLDRCVLAQTLLDEQWAVPADAAHRNDRLQVTDAVHSAMVLHHFLRHLRPEISDKLAFCQNLESLQDHVKAAERIEKAGTDKNFAAAAPQGVSAIQESHLAAIGGGQKQQQQKKKRQPPSYYTCRLCNVKGHFINDCPRSEKQQRKQGAQRGGQQQQVQQQQPPRHLGAIPKPSQWQRPQQQQQAAAINVQGQMPGQQQQFAAYQQQPQYPGYQPLYPTLPDRDFPEVSNLSLRPAVYPPAPPSHASSEWPVPMSGAFQAAAPEWPLPGAGFHQ